MLVKGNKASNAQRWGEGRRRYVGNGSALAVLRGSPVRPST